MNKIKQLISKEITRQQNTLDLIASENITSLQVRAAVGSVLMHKYAEGAPGKRYYQGNQYVDEIENEARALALKAFGLSADDWGVNVQVLSGSIANLAVYRALVPVGGKIMSMKLSHGGHLSHGYKFGNKPISFTSQIWEFFYYGVFRENLQFNYDQIQKLAKKYKPKLIISGGTAYPREIDYKAMGEIAKSVRAFYLADIAHEAGLIAAGVLQSPFKYADAVTLTTQKTLRGPRGAIIFSRKEISEKIDKAVFPGIQGGPNIATIAGIGVALEEVQTPEFKSYAKLTLENARILAEALKKYEFNLVTGGTDKHLILIDLRNKYVSGWHLALALEAAGIVVNKNTIPYDSGSPFYPNGLRLGTPNLATRGMGGGEMQKIADWINLVTKHIGPQGNPSLKFKTQVAKDNKLKKIKLDVEKLCQKFPIL